MWRRRGRCGVRRRPSCADWSAGFSPSIAGLRWPAVSGYASRLELSRARWTSVMLRSGHAFLDGSGRG